MLVIFFLNQLPLPPWLPFRNSSIIFELYNIILVIINKIKIEKERIIPIILSKEIDNIVIDNNIRKIIMVNDNKIINWLFYLASSLCYQGGKGGTMEP